MRALAAFLLCCFFCAAQNPITADQLIAFVKSSVERKMTDTEISRYLRTVKLSERLSESQFEDLVTAGLGSRSLQALHAIHDQSKDLPLATPAATPAIHLPPAPS